MPIEELDSSSKNILMEYYIALVLKKTVRKKNIENINKKIFLFWTFNKSFEISKLGEKKNIENLILMGIAKTS